MARDINLLVRLNDGELSVKEADMVNDYVMANYGIDMDTSEFGDVAQEQYDLIQEEEELTRTKEREYETEQWDAPYRHMV